MTDQERIYTLRQQLREHEHRYYVLNSPIISDQEFDFMMHELQDLEAKHPELYDPNSPTMRVGSDMDSTKSSATEEKKGFEKVKHVYPMLSLANTYNRDDIQEWYDQITKGLDGEKFEVCCEMKYDGLSISLIYKKGVLEKAVTRGDGEYGDDVTENIRCIKSIPKKLTSGDYPALFEIRGEVLMPWDAFNKLNEETEIKYANPRNLASGTLKQLQKRIKSIDPRATLDEKNKLVRENNKILEENEKKRKSLSYLDSYLYYLLGEELPATTHFDNLAKCAEWGFQMSRGMKISHSLDEVMDFIAFWDTERKKLPVATDGIVLKVNSLEQQKKLGYTAKSPRWAIAYKYKADRVSTRLKSVVYQVGKTGAITPVANMDPVQLAGTVVKRASLYNEDMIRNLDLHVGDEVYVEKGGEIIPKVVGVNYESRQENAMPIRFITNCPVCGSPLYREEKLSVTYCHNDAGCHVQVKGHIEQFVSRKAMNIMGLGEEDVAAFYDNGIIDNVADLYDVPQKIQTIIDSFKTGDEKLSKKEQDKLTEALKPFGESFGEQKAKNVRDSILASTNSPFEQVVYALGIRFIGENSAKLIARHFKTMDALRNAGVDDLLEIEGIGDVMAVSVYEFFRNPKIAEIVDRLQGYGLQMSVSQENIVEVVSDKLSGKSIVISGVFQHHSRDEYKVIIEKYGGKNVGSISGKTSFILAGDNMGPSKLQKANKLGIQIMNEDDFLTLINLNENE